MFPIFSAGSMNSVVSRSRQGGCAFLWSLLELAGVGGGESTLDSRQAQQFPQHCPLWFPEGPGSRPLLVEEATLPASLSSQD